jgi:molybdopterin molybdotransferase
MLTFQEALKKIEKNSGVLKSEVVDVKDSLGFILAEDVRAPFAMPIFDNAAMDGFAFSSIETKEASFDKPVILDIKGSIRAGDALKNKIGQGETFRIMTGASIPEGADTVLPKEAAVLRGQKLVVQHPVIPKHIRYRGEEIKKGGKLLSRFHRMGAATFGVLASFGIQKVKVFKKPRVSVIATGSELVNPGRPLSFGKIYDSNSAMVEAALRNMQILPCLAQTLGDQETVLKNAVKKALQKSDALILMGGVSVGDYDFVKRILKDLGVKQIFWGVRQKPGKPIYFGKIGKTLVFGLPGNPASCLVCFYEYVFPALRRSMGFTNPYLQEESVALEADVSADKKKVLFLKGKLVTQGDGQKRARVLGRQGSHMISSLSEADRLIVVSPNEGVLRSGERVTTHLLPS